MTALELVKEAVRAGKPCNDATAEYVLWAHTGFPSFWNIPTDGATPDECLRTQVRAYFASLPEETP